MSKQAVLMGGDPVMIKAALLDTVFAHHWAQSEASRSIEVPCQQCGRMVLVAPSGQRAALGGGRMVPVDVEALARREVKITGPTEWVDACPVICMWCACGHDSRVLAALDAALARAKKKLEDHNGTTAI